MSRKRLEDRFLHNYNPLVLYAKLSNMGVEREEAKRMTKRYEQDFYRPLFKKIKKRDYND